MRAPIGMAVVAALAACGGGGDVRFVVTTESEARATEAELRVGDETRFFEELESGQKVKERAVPEGTRVELRVRNGGDGGAVTVEAWQDGCAKGAQRCEGTDCTTFVEFTVDAACEN